MIRHVDLASFVTSLSVMNKLVLQSNPTLKSILKVEELFMENIEFDSKNQLLRKMDNGIKAVAVLNVILARLVIERKVIINDDNSLTWIYAEDNPKLKKSWAKAKPL